MYRKFFVCLALCGITSAANAQQPVQGYYVQPVPNNGAVGVANGAPGNFAHVQAPAGFASQTPTNGSFAIGGTPMPVGSNAVPFTMTSRQPNSVVPSRVVHPMPVAPGRGSIAGVVPQQTVAATSTWAGAGQPTRQTQVYTPTYYYYYYQQPYQVTQVAPVYQAPAPNPYAYGNVAGGYSNAGRFGPMSNARGEMGHVRLPYYSYRRPWYFPGQPSFNVTIPGPVW